DIFFLISGFIIWRTTMRADHRSVRAFVTKRFLRVVPLAWLATLVYFVALRGSPDLGVLIKSLLFIPLRNEEPPTYGYSLLGVEWTLVYELIFYAIFAVCLWVSPKHRGGLAIGAI